MDKDEILEVVVSHIIDVLPELEGHEFQAEDGLEELGANSVDRADIIMMTMESLSLQISRIELVGAQNIGELVDIIYEKLQ